RDGLLEDNRVRMNFATDIATSRQCTFFPNHPKGKIEESKETLQPLEFRWNGSALPSRSRSGSKCDMRRRHSKDDRRYGRKDKNKEESSIGSDEGVKQSRGTTYTMLEEGTWEKEV